MGADQVGSAGFIGDSDPALQTRQRSEARANAPIDSVVRSMKKNSRSVLSGKREEDMHEHEN